VDQEYSWCGLIRVIVNWIVAEVVLVCLASQSHSDIMVILFSGSSPGQCPSMPGPAAAYAVTIPCILLY